MIRQLNINWKNTEVPTEKVSKVPAIKKKFQPRTNISTLEYEIISNLVLQQYQQGNEIKFDQLLSIPPMDRIPGLIEAYGKKNIHKLLVMMITEFLKSLPIVKSKKLTETKISVAACEIMLTAYEDYLSLEDVMIFLQKAKAGNYGTIKNISHTSILFSLFEKYRQTRHAAYQKLQEAKHNEYKAMGDEMRTNGQPTQLENLLQQTYQLDISNRA